MIRLIRWMRLQWRRLMWATDPGIGQHITYSGDLARMQESIDRVVRSRSP